MSVCGLHEGDDLKTLATALLAHEVRPEARVVVQSRNPAVGRALTDIGVAVLGVAQLSAPSIVEGCLVSRRRSIRLSDEEFVVAASLARASGSLRELYGDLAPIAVVHAGSARVEVIPGREYVATAGDTVAVAGAPGDIDDLLWDEDGAGPAGSSSP